MKRDSLRALLIHELNDLYDAECQLDRWADDGGAGSPKDGRAAQARD